MIIILYMRHSFLFKFGKNLNRHWLIETKQYYFVGNKYTFFKRIKKKKRFLKNESRNNKQCKTYFRKINCCKNSCNALRMVCDGDIVIFYINSVVIFQIYWLLFLLKQSTCKYSNENCADRCCDENAQHGDSQYRFADVDII